MLNVTIRSGTLEADVYGGVPLHGTMFPDGVVKMMSNVVYLVSDVFDHVNVGRIYQILSRPDGAVQRVLANVAFLACKPYKMTVTLVGRMIV